MKRIGTTVLAFTLAFVLCVSVYASEIQRVDTYARSDDEVQIDLPDAPDTSPDQSGTTTQPDDAETNLPDTGTGTGTGSGIGSGIGSGTITQPGTGSGNNRTKPVTASFSGGSDAVGSTTAISAERGTLITLPTSGFTRDGYEFAGWSLGSSVYQPGSVYTLSESVTFTAVWTTQQGGSVILSDGYGQTVTLSAKYGERITLPGNPFTREGYTFTGWSDGGGIYQPGDTYTVGQDTVLTAQWVVGTSVESGSGDGTSSTDIGSGFDVDVGVGITAGISYGESSGTVTNEDGSTTMVESWADGSVSRTVVTADGMIGVTVIDQQGNYREISATVTQAATLAAEANGQMVTLPVMAPLAETSESALTISISVPASAGSVKVEIPMEEVTAGSVAMVVQSDSTEKLVKTSQVTDKGISLTVTGDTTVKIVDNSKYFTDIPDTYWAKEEVDLVSSRELFNGTTSDTFTPDAPTTRAQLMTVLARLDDADTSGAALQKGMAWAVESGVSDGTDPNSSVTRQQLAVMLYRYANNPSASGSLESYPDAEKVSDYATEAMRWAVENGIITGRNDGSLDPTGLATRAQVAVMVSRYMAKTV